MNEPAKCLTCGDLLPEPGLFCSPECRTASTKGALKFRAARKRVIPDERRYVEQIKRRSESWRDD